MTEKQLIAVQRRKIRTYSNYLYNTLVVLKDTLGMSDEEFKGFCTKELGISKNAYDALMYGGG